MSNNSNRINVPEAKGAMDKSKIEVASKIDVPLTSGYNGNLISAQNGSAGGYTVRKMIESYECQLASKQILRY